MKIVYALVSSPSDLYLEQAYVSMHSVRVHMPKARITLVTDSISNETFVGVRKEELKYVDELIVLSFDSTFSQQQRSRLVKTSLRQNIEGDFIYIDCDTIICKPFPEISSAPTDIMACPDTHCKNLMNDPYRWLALRDGRKLNWPVEKETTYFNGGVLYVKDTSVAHEFYRLWNRNLLDSFSKGISMDQPALAKSNYQMGHIIGVLGDIWNCQLKHGIRFLKDAVIVHYLTTNVSRRNTEQLFILNDTKNFDCIKSFARIPDAIEKVIHDPFLGIAPMTHCFAGDDIYFFQTQSYAAISASTTDYKAGLVSQNERNKEFLQSDLFFYCLRHFPNLLTMALERIIQRLGRIKRFCKSHM